MFLPEYKNDCYKQIGHWYKPYLNCPVCNKDCVNIPANEPTDKILYRWWKEDSTGTCECGSNLIVKVDDDLAYLEEVWKLICLNGLAGSGKDTFAHMFEPYGWLKIGFADGLKRTLMDSFEFTYEQLWGSSHLRNEIDLRYGFSPREALQKIGSTYTGLYKNVFVDEVFEAIDMCKTSNFFYSSISGLMTNVDDKKYNGVIISDGRYINELEAVRNAGGKLVRIKRDGAGLKTIHAKHSSEMESQSISDDYFDHIIDNNQDFDQLRSLVVGLALK